MDRSQQSAENRAARRSGALTGVLWHVVTFLIMNAFFWFIDLRQGGVDWAYWISLFWGIALAFHAAWYLITERGIRKYDDSLDRERRV